MPKLTKNRKHSPIISFLTTLFIYQNINFLGIFNIFQTTFSLTFAKLMGAIVTPCYVAYAVLIVILSLNQLTQLCFPRIDEILFSKKARKLWITFCIFLYICFTAALATPVATIRYYPGIWSWAYDHSFFGSEYVHKTAMIIELAGIPIAGIIYVAIFGVLIAKVSILILKS